MDNSHTASNAGFVTGSPTYLGASPDGIVKQKDTPVKFIKIKCPFSARHISVKDAWLTRIFGLLESNAIHLKDVHPYYYHVQGTTIAITYSMDTHVQEIKFDADLWNMSMLPKLQEFYKSYMLPAILYYCIVRSFHGTIFS